MLRQGSDISIFAIGSGVDPALKAHDMLKEKNIESSVLNCRFVKPLDVDLISQEARKTRKVITVEENVLQGGFGSAVLECLSDQGISNCILRRIGVADTFVEHGPQRVLRSKYGLDAAAITTVALQMLDTK
jgi:1-deoxy-D-xylulose-5-phosphate synthase